MIFKKELNKVLNNIFFVHFAEILANFAFPLLT